jgi:hypothetical protein
MIAQYGERRRKGVVMVPEGVNGEGWASFSRAFQAVVNSFVADDKAKRRIVDDRRRQGKTYAGVVANSQGLQNVDQRVLPRKEGAVGVNNSHLLRHTGMETSAGGTHGGPWRSGEIRARIQALKGELDELIRLVGSEPDAGCGFICCHRCGMSVEESSGNGQLLATLDPKGSSSKVAQTKDKQFLVEPIREPQTRTEQAYSVKEDGVEVAGLVKNVDSGFEAVHEAERWPKEGEPIMANMETITMDASDTFGSDKGLVSDENQKGCVLAEGSACKGVEEYEETGLANRVLNTYNRRCLKPLQGGEQGLEKALVVWVDYGKKGEIDSGVIPVEEVEGHIFADGLSPSNWVLQKIQEFSRMVGVSCNGHERELMDLFEALETNRGQEKNTQGNQEEKVTVNLSALNGQLIMTSRVEIPREGC